MTKSIEQIALEVAEEMPCIANGITFETHGYVCYTKDELAEHFRRCLAKIGEGLEPDAYATTNEDGDLTMLFFDKGEAFRYSGDDDEPISLYTTPHEAIIAAEQRVSEACAELAKANLMNTSLLMSNPPKSRAAWDIVNAIRSGEWRKYL